MDMMKNGWKKTPDRVRRPTVLIVGIFFVLLSGTVGWLPGPGGIPIFLLGIAILASEFEWAHSLKERILGVVQGTGKWIRAHKVSGSFLIFLSACISFYIMYKFFISK